MKNRPNGILAAVQEIDNQTMYLYENQAAFFDHLNIVNYWKLEDVEFRGVYLTFTYSTHYDETHKMQIPLFDYVTWRRKNDG